MKLGELRWKFKELPDDTDIVVDNGDAVYIEVNDVDQYPPVLDHSWCIVLNTGGEVTTDLDMRARDGLG